MTSIQQEHKGVFEYLVFSDKKTAKNALKYRPGMRDALRSLRRGDVLVSTKIDRIARNGGAAYLIQDELVDLGVKLKLTDQPHMNDPLMFAMMVGLSIKEVEMISTRTKDKLQNKKRVPCRMDLNSIQIRP
jgi:DNA invertase Pin-like site-specific DNA recombinase